MKKVLGSFVAILLLSHFAIADSVTIETDKKIYNQSELINFTMYNNNLDNIDIDFKPSILNNTGKCIWGCIWAAIYDPITIAPGGNYSWTWNQKGENGNVAPGIYKGILEGYYSNNFEIVDNGKMFTYYRELGQDHNIMETNDLLKAADDWRSDIVAPGFSFVITTGQLLTAADEWRNS